MKTTELVEFGKTVANIATELDDNKLLSKVFSTKKWVDPDEAEAKLSKFLKLRLILGVVDIEVNYDQASQTYDILIPKMVAAKFNTADFDELAVEVMRTPQGGILIVI